MLDETIISVENITKSYRIWHTPSQRLVSPVQHGLAGIFPPHSAPAKYLHAQASRSYRDFYALRNISFTVRRGEAVGIIGRNGSGKSTLLQIIAGTLQQTSGSMRTTGRVAALLELGSGFNPEFTGRENVYLNGAVLGLTRGEINQRFDQIASFAEIGDFMDQPVKTYSSGMMVRLAFAVAISVQPDILIVDEALSVGDLFFQQKCFKRVHEMLDSGVSLLFVSHDPAAVQNLCDRAILLHQGETIYQGAPEECTSRYFARYDSVAASQRPPSAELPPTLARTVLFEHNLVTRARARHGDRRLEVVAISVRHPGGAFSLQFSLMQQLCIEVLVRANAPVAVPSCGLHFFDRMNNLVYAAGNVQLGVPCAPLDEGATALLTYTVTMSVHPGLYTFNIAAGEPDPVDVNLGLFYDVCEGLGPIEITPPPTGTWPFFGIANLPMKMDISYD